ncbi:MAG: DMT family transporter [Clostridia bacterium]|nr:DMT family transporter [Clostridia bacterium]
MNATQIRGHAAAFVTIFIWGTTFISTKLLLEAFQPLEILFLRFVLGFAALIIACPRRCTITDRRQEAVFAAAGLCGIFLYYLLENVALSYTMASNVGVIISVAPCFTALLTRALGSERLQPTFFVGFAVALLGIGLMNWGGSRLCLNPLGDLLALGAAAVWAAYAVLSRKISRFGYPVIQSTRRIFGYGLLFMLPCVALSGAWPDMRRLTSLPAMCNLLYLGLGASALCFVTWNFAVGALGALRTSAYIYAVPVITVATSALVLHEPVTPATVIGTALTLTGLLISERKNTDERRNSHEPRK